jgi:hypothetical protein
VKQLRQTILIYVLEAGEPTNGMWYRGWTVINAWKIITNGGMIGGRETSTHLSRHSQTYQLKGLRVHKRTPIVIY